MVTSHIVDLKSRYNRFPDEKGTESLDLYRLASDTETVTIVSPMKRGLKVRVECLKNFKLDVTIVSPMKRGLKVEVLEGDADPAVKLQSFPR